MGGRGFRWDLRWAVGWTVVYACNLLVPLMFAALVTDTGRLGMTAAVVAFWSAGLVVCQRPGRLRLALAIGAVAVSLSQCFPLLHITAGAVAMVSWSRLTGGNSGQGLSELGGFVVTVTTGQLLVLAVLAIGYAYCWLTGWPERPAGETDSAV